MGILTKIKLPLKKIVPKSRKATITVIALVAIVALAGAWFYHHQTLAKQTLGSAGSPSDIQNLTQAKKELLLHPNDINDMLAVAYMTKVKNPQQAKQYFLRALNEFKKQNNPDVPGKSAVVYWSAAGIAVQAGQINQAKKYYEEVIAAAKPSNSYDQSLASQSRTALEGLL